MVKGCWLIVGNAGTAKKESSIEGLGYGCWLLVGTGEMDKTIKATV